MLRIKNNVNLKELEKFGMFKRCNYYTKENEYNIEVISVIEDERTLEDLCDNTAIDTLYDLIQAGLVEKVDDNK